MNAILYARFSPRPNAAECESVESQLTDLRAYCAKHGHEILGEFDDKALSGSDDWEDRPGMFEAASRAKRGCLFLVRSLDRLFRDTRKALIFKHMLSMKGVALRSTTEEAACGGTPEADLMEKIFLAIAEYQRLIICARTRIKMRQHQANGRRMSAIPPYGWTIDSTDRSKLVPCPKEQAVIRQIVRHRKEGHGFRAIARRLNQTGTPARAAAWNHMAIKRILRREGVLDLDAA